MSKFSEKRKAAVDEMLRDTVYEAAVKVLLDQGIGALTMERLAGLAGVSRATLYNYFRDRDDLVIYVEDRIIAPLREQMGTIMHSDAEPRDKLRGLAEAALRYLDQHRGILLSVYDKETVEGARREAQIQRREAFRELFANVIQEGIDSGQFRQVHVARAAEIFEGGLLGLVDGMVDRNSFLPPEETVPHFVSIFLHGINK
jgi:AcrR family transcriptional regulator